MNLAIDLDGVLASWERPKGYGSMGNDGFSDGVGGWIPGAQEALRALLAAEHRIVVHTCRATWQAGGGAPAVMEFVSSGIWTPPDVHFQPRLVVGTEQELGYHASGARTWHMTSLAPDLGDVGIWVGVGKPIAHFYIDDRGITFDPVRGWEPVLEIVAALAAA